VVQESMSHIFLKIMGLGVLVIPVKCMIIVMIPVEIQKLVVT
jgi:hypothetical protein